MRRFDAMRRIALRDRPTLCRNGSVPESRSKLTGKLFSLIRLKLSSLKPKATMCHCGIGLTPTGCGSPSRSWRRYSSRTVLFGFIDPYLLTVCLWSRSSRCRRGHTDFVQGVEKSTQLHGPTRTILNRWQQPGSGPTFFLIHRKIKNQSWPPLLHKNDAHKKTVYGGEGILTWTVEGTPIEVGLGQALCVRGAVHRFDNLGSKHAPRCNNPSPKHTIS